MKNREGFSWIAIGLYDHHRNGSECVDVIARAAHQLISRERLERGRASIGERSEAD